MYSYVCSLTITFMISSTIRWRYCFRRSCSCQHNVYILYKRTFLHSLPFITTYIPPYIYIYRSARLYLSMFANKVILIAGDKSCSEPAVILSITTGFYRLFPLHIARGGRALYCCCQTLFQFKYITNVLCIDICMSIRAWVHARVCVCVCVSR